MAKPTVKIDKVNSLMSDDHKMSAKICYSYETGGGSATITSYYRAKYFDTEWKKGEAYTTPEASGSHCITLSDLKPNQTDYQVYLHIKSSGGEANSETEEFITLVVPNPEIRICEDLDYLSELICQAVTSLYNGRIKVFSNPYTKSQCDPNNPIPTNLTLWSRALRMFHAMLCLTCDMGYEKIGSGKSIQYLAGEKGWTDFGTNIEEDEGKEWRLPFSGTVWQYIKDKMHEVWHYHGEVDYLVNTLGDLSDKAFNNATRVIIASESKIYKKSGNRWVIDTTETPDNFAVYHIKYASETDFGEVLAGSAYYYFEGTWNNLDADIRELDARMKVMERAGKVLKQDNDEEDMKVLIVDENYDYSSLPNNERVICLVAEPSDKAEPETHTITYETGNGAPKVPPETVVDGARAQKPEDPIWVGYGLVRWEDKDHRGKAFDFEQEIHKDYTLVAVWDARMVTVEYDIGEEAMSEKPPSAQARYGEKIPVPSKNPTREGYTFKGWARDGVQITDSDTLNGDTVLTAIWEIIKLTVTFHPENGGENTVVTVDWGYEIPQIEDPTKKDKVFVGWFLNGREDPFDFNTQIRNNTDLYAHWADEYYTITFVPGGGNGEFTQKVRYRETVLPPAVPEWKGEE